MFKVAFALFFISLDIQCKAMLNFIPEDLVQEKFTEIPQSIQNKHNENDFWSAMNFLDYQELTNPLQNYIKILEQDIFKTHQIQEKFKQEDNNKYNPEINRKMINNEKQSKKRLSGSEMINIMEEIQTSTQDIPSVKCSQIQ